MDQERDQDKSKGQGRGDPPARAPDAWRVISSMSRMDRADLMTLCKAAGSAARYADRHPDTAPDAPTLAALVAAVYDNVQGQGAEPAAGIVGYIDADGAHKRKEKNV